MANTSPFSLEFIAMFLFFARKNKKIIDDEENSIDKNCFDEGLDFEAISGSHNTKLPTVLINVGAFKKFPETVKRTCEALTSASKG